MTTFRVSQPSDNSAYVPVIWFTALFAVFTYAAISARAVLSPYEVNYLIDAKRLFSVAVGTFVLWLSIHCAARFSNEGPRPQIFAVLNIAIPGMIGLLVAREAYDLVASGTLAEKLALNVRFMLMWVGYFVATVAAFLALGFYRQLHSAKASRTKWNENHEVKTFLTVLRAETGYESADIDVAPEAYARAQRLAQIDRLLKQLG